MALEPDGSIVIAANGFYTGHPTVEVVRFNSSGIATEEPVTIDFGSSHSWSTILGVAIDSNGKIVIDGQVDNDFALVRLNPDLTADTSLNSDGIALIAMSAISFIKASVFQNDGKIVITGQNSSGHIVIARYNADGTLDTSFATSGSADFGSGAVYGVGLQSDGKIDLVGNGFGGRGDTGSLFGRFIGDSSSISYLLTDGHGSTALMTDSSGNVTATFSYDAFGTALNFNAATAGTQILFGGDAIYDPASGLYMHGDGIRPTLGFLFIQMDPTQGSKADPISLHKYLLDDANPVDEDDPSGHDSEAQALLEDSLSGDDNSESNGWILLMNSGPVSNIVDNPAEGLAYYEQGNGQPATFGPGAIDYIIQNLDYSTIISHSIRKGVASGGFVRLGVLPINNSPDPNDEHDLVGQEVDATQWKVVGSTIELDLDKEYRWSGKVSGIFSGLGTTYHIKGTIFVPLNPKNFIVGP